MTKDPLADLHPRQSGESPQADERFSEPVKYRYMRLGLPAGLGFLALVATYLADGLSLPLTFFLIVFVALIAESTALALLTAHSVQLRDEGFVAAVPLGSVRIPWTSISLLESDRRDLAIPRRLLRVAGREQFFMFDSIERFDELGQRVATATGRPVFPMPLWKRLLFLQWGV